MGLLFLNAASKKQTHPAQWVGLKAVKKKKATKAWGKHQRIYIRRSLRTKERWAPSTSSGTG